MEQNFDKLYWDQKTCPKHDCHKETCQCGLKFVSLMANLGDDSEGSSIAPKKGMYCNAIVRYESNGAIYIYSTEGIPVKVKEGENGA